MAADNTYPDWELSSLSFSTSWDHSAACFLARWRTFSPTESVRIQRTKSARSARDAQYEQSLRSWKRRVQTKNFYEKRSYAPVVDTTTLAVPIVGAIRYHISVSIAP